MLLSLRYAFHQAKECIISGVWLGLVVNRVKFHRHLKCISGQRYLKLDEINIEIESGTGGNIKLASNHFKLHLHAYLKNNIYIMRD